TGGRWFEPTQLYQRHKFPKSNPLVSEFGPEDVDRGLQFEPLAAHEKAPEPKSNLEKAGRGLAKAGGGSSEEDRIRNRPLMFQTRTLPQFELCRLPDIKCR